MKETSHSDAFALQEMDLTLEHLLVTQISNENEQQSNTFAGHRGQCKLDR